MVGTVSIFVTIIINKSLLISFLVDQKTLRLRLRITGLIICKMMRILHLSTKLLHLAQPADNFVLSNEDRNLLNRFETNSVYEFNLSSREPSPRRLPLAPRHNTQPNVISKWDIPEVKKFGTRTPGFDIVCRKVKNTFDSSHTDRRRQLF